ncbi:MAG: pyridoxamine 5'-phosphate oxidase [Gemmatimonadetes bacterium]|nr:pyridoxamine 5'-phosphate oxidase [Gemmatimonadota bacterium]
MTESSLRETDVDPDPVKQFSRWFDDAQHAGLIEPSAMSLATASRQGIPSVRLVLLKGFDDRGFVFYTNYQSPKARDLLENPQAALAFWWDVLQRQVRISGDVARVSQAESDAYFLVRPVGSRLGAHASSQSSVIKSRDDLERQVEALRKQYADGNVPRPEHWGGFRLTPRMLEFWQGRADRLHDRLRYQRKGGAWVIERLAP